MTGARMTSSWAAEKELLTQEIRYALGTVRTITPEQLRNPTPCQGWDLRLLLKHATESLAALREGISIGHVSLVPAGNPGAPPSMPSVTRHACSSRRCRARPFTGRTSVSAASP